MDDFSQNASAFNCGLIAFKNFDMGRVAPARFPWQQHRSRQGAALASKTLHPNSIPPNMTA